MCWLAAKLNKNKQTRKQISRHTMRNSTTVTHIHTVEATLVVSTPCPGAHYCVKAFLLYTSICELPWRTTGTGQPHQYPKRIVVLNAESALRSLRKELDFFFVDRLWFIYSYYYVFIYFTVYDKEQKKIRTNIRS